MKQIFQEKPAPGHRQDTPNTQCPTGSSWEGAWSLPSSASASPAAELKRSPASARTNITIALLLDTTLAPFISFPIPWLVAEGRTLPENHLRLQKLLGPSYRVETEKSRP